MKTKVLNKSFFKHKQLLIIVFNKNPKVKLLPKMLTLNVNRVCRQKLFTKIFTKIVVKSIFEQTFFKEFIHKLLTKNVTNKKIVDKLLAKDVKKSLNKIRKMYCYRRLLTKKNVD